MVPHDTQSMIHIKMEGHCVSNLQTSIQNTSVQNIASTHLHISHQQLHILFLVLGNEAFITHLAPLLCIEAGVVQKDSNGLAIRSLIHTVLVMENGNNSGGTGDEGVLPPFVSVILILWQVIGQWDSLLFKLINSMDV